MQKIKTTGICGDAAVRNAKKRLTFESTSFWVPYGIRTHDIQNHNLTL